MKHMRSAAGFSLLELAVTFTVIGILAAVFIDRAAFYRQQAEDIVFKATLLNIRTGLRAQVTNLTLRADDMAMRRLENVNPVVFLLSPPTNYRGEMPDAEGEKLPKSNWYYSTDTKNLVYLLNSGNFVAIGGQKSLNFKVKLLRVPNNPVNPQDVLSRYTAVLEQVDG